MRCTFSGLPYPVSASAITGRPLASVTRATFAAISVSVASPTSGIPSDAAVPNPVMYSASNPTDPATRAGSQEVQGVFVIHDSRAEFRKVETGISGASEIEVTNGLTAGDEIITGSYKVIRTIRNQTRVVVDNKLRAEPAT